MSEAYLSQQRYELLYMWSEKYPQENQKWIRIEIPNSDQSKEKNEWIFLQHFQ